MSHCVAAWPWLGSSQAVGFPTVIDGDTGSSGLAVRRRVFSQRVRWKCSEPWVVNRSVRLYSIGVRIGSSRLAMRHCNSTNRGIRASSRPANPLLARHRGVVAGRRNTVCKVPRRDKPTPPSPAKTTERPSSTPKTANRAYIVKTRGV